MVTRDLTLFGRDLNECDEGIWMFKNKTKLVGRFLAAGALSMAMVASAVSVASASDHGGHHSGHDGGGSVTQSMKVEGVVTAYSLSGLSISLTTKGSSSPVTYVLTTTTTVNGLAATATAPIVGDNVDLVLSTTLPTTVISIVIDKVHPQRVEGVVTAYSLSGLSLSLTTKTSSSPVAFVLTTATTVNGLAATASAPIVGDNVDLVLSTTLPTTVISIVIDKVHGMGLGGFSGSGSHNFGGNAGHHHGGGH